MDQTEDVMLPEMAVIVMRGMLKCHSIRSWRNVRIRMSVLPPPVERRESVRTQREDISVSVCSAPGTVLSAVSVCLKKLLMH